LVEDWGTRLPAQRLIPVVIRIATSVAALVLPALPVHAVDIEFVPENPALNSAVRAYAEIWQLDGERIVAALEARSCLEFPEEMIAAIVADGTSHSGGPEHPMQLRATYPTALKRSTLVHEIGHRHLWQLEERLDDLDGHKTLYLILDLVWADVWGESFSMSRIADESDWEANYDYAAAWNWARELEAADRSRLWQQLLRLNGFAACEAP
jgi:hypothetical protein